MECWGDLARTECCVSGPFKKAQNKNYSVLQAEQPQLPQPVLTGEVLQLSGQSDIVQN